VPAAAAPVAQHFAALAGGVFQPAESAPASDIHALTREFAQVLALQAAALAPESPSGAGFSRAESAAMVRELDMLLSQALALRGWHLANGGAA